LLEIFFGSSEMFVVFIVMEEMGEKDLAINWLSRKTAN
jgi:hypothetical protein